MSTTLKITKTGVAVFSVILIYSGLLLEWQLANQPSTTGCYTFPMGTMTFLFFLQPYQGGCQFNQLPNYYAGDLGIAIVLIGVLLIFVRVGSGGRGR